MALSNALHTKEITTAQINGLTFGFFTEEEVCSNDEDVTLRIPLTLRLHAIGQLS